MLYPSIVVTFPAHAGQCRASSDRFKCPMAWLKTAMPYAEPCETCGCHVAQEGGAYTYHCRSSVPGNRRNAPRLTPILARATGGELRFPWTGEANGDGGRSDPFLPAAGGGAPGGRSYRSRERYGIPGRRHAGSGSLSSQWRTGRVRAYNRRLAGWVAVAMPVGESETLRRVAMRRTVSLVSV